MAQCVGVGSGLITCTVIDDAGNATAIADLTTTIPPIVDSDFTQNDDVIVDLQAIATNLAGDASAESDAVSIFDVDDTTAGDLILIQNGQFDVFQSVSATSVGGDASLDRLRLADLVDVREIGSGNLYFENTGDVFIVNDIEATTSSGSITNPSSISGRVFEGSESDDGDFTFLNSGDFDVEQRVTLSATSGAITGHLRPSFNETLYLNESGEGDFFFTNTGDFRVSQHVKAVAGGLGSNDVSGVRIADLSEILDIRESGDGSLWFENSGDFHLDQTLEASVTNGNLASTSVRSLDQAIELREGGEDSLYFANHGDFFASQTFSILVENGDVEAVRVFVLDEIIDLVENSGGDLTAFNYGDIHASQELSIDVANGGIKGEGADVTELDQLFELTESGPGTLTGANYGDIHASQKLTIETSGGNIEPVEVTGIKSLIEALELAEGSLDFGNYGNVSASQEASVIVSGGDILSVDVRQINSLLKLEERDPGQLTGSNSGDFNVRQALAVSTVGIGGDIHNASIGETGDVIFASESGEDHLMLTNSGNVWHDQMLTANATNGSVTVNAVTMNNALGAFEFDDGNLELENSGNFWINQVVEATATGGGDVTVANVNAQGFEADERGDGNLIAHSYGDVTIKQEIVADAQGGGTVTVTNVSATGMFIGETDMGDLDFHHSGDVLISQSLSHGTGVAYGIIASEIGGGTLTLTKQGKVLVHADTAYAIDLRVDDPASMTTLNLLPETPISGLMSASMGDDTLNLSRGASWDLTFTPDDGQTDAAGPNQGLPELIETFGAPVYIDAANNRIITFDPAANVFDQESDAFADLTAAINKAARNRLGKAGAEGGSGGPIRRQREVWAQGIGSDRSNGDEIEFVGVIGGVDVTFENGLEAGIFLGGTVGSIDENTLVSHDIDQDSWFGGVYGRKDLPGFGGHGTFADFVLTAGGQSSDSMRDVVDNRQSDGVQTYKGSYDGWFVNSYATLGTVLPLPMLHSGTTLTPSIGVGYAGLFQDGFSETGGDAAAWFDDRDVHLLYGRAALELSNRLQGEVGTLTSTATIGVQARTNFGDDSTASVLLIEGTTVATPLDSNSDVAGFVGAELDFSTADGFSLFAGGEFVYEGDDTTVMTGRFGGRLRF